MYLRNLQLTNIAAIAGGVVAFTPATLGAKLLGWWNADDAATITLAVANVTSWKDKVAAYDMVQATGGSQPIYSVTSFNGAPGITFDGTDDFLEMGVAPVSFPASAVPSEIWGLAQNNEIGANAGNKYIFSYGALAGNVRGIQRTAISTVNRGQAQTGASISAEGTVDFSSRSVIRSLITATTTTAFVDGNASAGVGVVPATTATRARIGASSAAAAGNFFLGIIREVIVTDGTLTAGEVTNLQTYMLARR